MTKKRPSFSSEIVALMRAVETRHHLKRGLVNDPFAEPFIRPLYRRVIRNRFLSQIACRYVDYRATGFQGGIIGRTCYIDDLLTREINSGLEQVVIIGSGLDARALRIETLKDLPVFELDFPGTLEYKKEVIGKISGQLPANMHYIPLDLNREKFGDRLLEAGYNPSAKTFYICEGLTMYLTSEAVDAIFSFVRKNSGAGSSIHFDYMRKAVLDGRCQLPESKKIRASASFSGDGEEQFLFGMNESEIHDFLENRGFQLIEDLKGDELQDKYQIPYYVHRLFGYVYAKLIGN